LEKGTPMGQNAMIERMRRILLICADKKLEVLVLGGKFKSKKIKLKKN
jgi:hypothetical protein